MVPFPRLVHRNQSAYYDWLGKRSSITRPIGRFNRGIHAGLAEEAATVTELQQQLMQSQQQASTLPEAVQNLQQELRGDLDRLQRRSTGQPLAFSAFRVQI